MLLLGLVVCLAAEPPRAEAELLALANAPPNQVSASTRRQALLDLARLGTPKAVDAIARGLVDDNTAELSAGAIGYLPTPAAQELLPRCLSLKLASARRSCLSTAQKLGDPRCAPPLLALARANGEPSERARSVEALVAIANRAGDARLAQQVVDLGKDAALKESVGYALNGMKDPALAPVVRALLSHADPEFRLRACRVVARTGDEASVTPLLQRLASEKETRVRDCVVTALAHSTPRSRAGEVALLLVPLWSDAQLDSTVVKTLVGLDQGAVLSGPVLKAVESPDYKERRRGIDALQKLQLPQAADALARVVRNDPEDAVRRAALPVLAMVATQPDHVAAIGQNLQESRLSSAAHDAVAKFRQPAVAPHLFPLLKHEDAQVRRHICRALGELGEGRAAVPMMDVVASDDTDFVARACAEELPKVAGPDNVPRLLKMLESRQGGAVADQLALAVVTVDRAQAFKVTLPLVQKRDPMARRLALRLSADVHPSDEAVFQQMAADRDVDWRRESMYGLMQLRSTSARQALCRALSEKDPSIRHTAVEGLRGFRDRETVDCLVDAWLALKKGSSPNMEEEIPSALREVTGQQLPDEVAAWKTWRDGGLGLGTGEDAMLSALRHDTAQVRVLAALTLLNGARPKDVNRVADAAAAALAEEKDTSARSALIGLLGRLGRVKDVPVLVAALEEKPSLEERVALARALDGLGDARGTLGFIEDLGSDNPRTREDAVRSLSTITGEPFHPQPAFWQAWWKTHGERYRREP